MCAGSSSLRSACPHAGKGTAAGIDNQPARRDAGREATVAADRFDCPRLCGQLAAGECPRTCGQSLRDEEGVSRGSPAD